MAQSDWWKDLPCHLSPKWNLHETTELDVEKLKKQVKVDLQSDPEYMKTESLLYLAFLEVPPKGKSFVRTRMPNRRNALKLIDEADKYVTATMEGNKHAKIGYGLVINALRIWIFSGQKNTSKQEETEKQLMKLHDMYQNDQKSGAYVKVTKAFALTRLGLQRYREAQGLFEKALQECPQNTHWMFGWALMQGRLARYARSRTDIPSDLPKEIEEQFQDERKKLEEIRKIDGNFAWPIAYLGWCLYNLNQKTEALDCIEPALELNKGNADVALICSRIHKWSGNLDKCHQILESLPEDSKTAEVVFQLGLVYNERARNLQRTEAQSKGNESEEIPELLRKALDYMEDTLAKDSCHLPAAIKCAEINARIGNHEAANDFYLNLFEREDVQLVPINEIHVRRSFHSVKQVFEASEALENVKKILQLYVHNFTTFDENGEGTFHRSVKTIAEGFLKELEEKSEDVKDGENLQAKLFLAEIQRSLGKYEKAKKLLEKLINSNNQNQLNPELRWNLAKCFMGLDCLDKAEGEAKALKELPPKREFPANEIYADVFMARAEKGMLANPTISRNQDGYNSIVNSLKNAIRLGSIKACYLYVTKYEGLQERLCSSEETIVETIAEIEVCLERSDIFHKKFDESPDNPIDAIKWEIKSILVHPCEADKSLPENIVKQYESLSNMRTSLRDFEGCYLQLDGSSASWNRVCQDAATKVLSHARELLDHVIFDYQKEVRKKPGEPEVTKFPVHMDWDKAEVDDKLVKTKFEGYVKSKFPGYTMPEEMVDFFIQLQPMYSKDNLWLAALCEFTSKKKHTSRKGDSDDTHFITLKKAESIPYKKVKLVRRSCYEVEKIVERLLTYFRVNFNKTVDDTGQTCSTE